MDINIDLSPYMPSKAILYVLSVVVNYDDIFYSFIGGDTDE